MRYGLIDVEWILHTLAVVRDVADSNQSFLGVSEKGRGAVESMVLARHFMHRHVYQHHTRLICDAMVSRAVELSNKDHALDEALFHYRSEIDYLMQYLKFDDDGLLSMLRESASEGASHIAARLQSRDLFKECYSIEISAAEFPHAPVLNKLLSLTNDDMKRYEQEIAEGVGMEPALVILSRQELTKPTYRGTPSQGLLDAKSLLIVREDGTARELDQISPIFNGLRTQIPVVLSCYAPTEGQSEAQQSEARTKIRNKASDVVAAIGG